MNNNEGTNVCSTLPAQRKDVRKNALVGFLRQLQDTNQTREPKLLFRPNENQQLLYNSQFQVILSWMSN